MIAIYPEPDNVKHVSEVDLKLDGCFIGACTTAEEDLILGALVLSAALDKGIAPTAKGHRRVTPGSVSIVSKLRRLGLIDIYEKAGFEVGAPGCSYCLGIAADKAAEGEIWLSSQNRNFRNRMGKGSIGNLASAATVAASSFHMKVTDPRSLLDTIDKERYAKMLEIWLTKGDPITIIEPAPQLVNHAVQSTGGEIALPDRLAKTITGRAQVFEDNIDTDAIIPAEFMPGISDEELGTHCFQYVKPEFTSKVKSGQDIIVAGSGFGSGSSREEAVRAIKGCGVKAVIAKSYAFIYARNQPNLGLLGIIVEDSKFYELATDGVEVSINVPEREIKVKDISFKFNLSKVEEKLLAGGGVIDLYKKYNNNMFRAVASPISKSGCGTDSTCHDDQDLSW